MTAKDRHNRWWNRIVNKTRALVEKDNRLAGHWVTLHQAVARCECIKAQIHLRLMKKKAR